MANYSLVTQGSYNPFSFQEIMAPIILKQQQHEKIEEGLADLDAKASVFEGMINPNLDVETNKQFQKYANDLRAQADVLATSGINPNSRRALMKLKSRYGAEITPIEQAYTARDLDIKAQQEATTKDPSIRFNQNAKTMSLDNYLRGQRPDYTSVNLDTITAQSAAGAQAMSKRYFNTTEGKMFKDVLLKITTENGIRPEQALQIIESGKSDAFPEFEKFMNTLRTKFNYNKFSNIDKTAIDSAILQGFNTGIVYNQDVKPMQNPDHLTPKDEFDMRMAKKQFALQKERVEIDKLTNGIVTDPDTGKSYFDPRVKAGLTEVPLPNGGKAEPIKGNNWKITNPDGSNGGIVSNKDFTEKYGGEDEDGKSLIPKSKFTRLDFTENFDDLMDPGITDWFIESNFTGDNEKVDFGTLSLKQQEKIAASLVPYGMKIDDVDIYRDHDIFSHNHIRIVKKGAYESGVPRGNEETNTSQIDSLKTDSLKPGYGGGW